MRPWIVTTSTTRMNGTPRAAADPRNRFVKLERNGTSNVSSKPLCVSPVPRSTLTELSAFDHLAFGTRRRHRTHEQRQFDAA